MESPNAEGPLPERSSGKVERTHFWLNRFRKLLVSLEKTEASFVELLTLAAALICWRQTIVIYG